VIEMMIRECEGGRCCDVCVCVCVCELRGREIWFLMMMMMIMIIIMIFKRSADTEKDRNDAGRMWGRR
jgi:hypothetical protein